MPGREKVGGPATVVRLGDGVAERIDAVAGKGGRAAFIREAVEERLSGRGSVAVAPKAAAVEKSAPVKREASPAQALKSDEAELLARLRERRGTARSVAKDLGWEELRVAKVGERLSSAKLVRFDRGVMEAV